MKVYNGISQKESSTDFQTSFRLGYLCRDVEVQLESISNETGGTISGFELAGRMGTFLLSKKSRQGLGPQGLLHSLRRETPKYGTAMEPLEMGRHSLGNKTHKPSVKKKRVISAAGRAVMAKAQQKRWAEIKRKQRAKSKANRLVQTNHSAPIESTSTSTPDVAA